MTNSEKLVWAQTYSAAFIEFVRERGLDNKDNAADAAMMADLAVEGLRTIKWHMLE